MKIIVLGTATIDIILKTKQTITSGSKIEIDDSFLFLGGGALNAATTFKNLNLDYLAYFRLGKDLIGNIISQKINKEKIMAKIFYHRGASQFSIVVLIPQKERTIFVYRGLSDHFDLKELNQIQQGRYYYLTTAKTPPVIFEQFLKKIKKQSKLTALNPSKYFLCSPRAVDCLRLVDVLFLNYEEASVFLKSKTEPQKLIKMLYQKIHIPIIVLTLGQKGSLTWFNNQIFQADIFKPKKIVDTTGAGDAFASAFFANLVISHKINEETIKKSIIWGSANASANIEKLGAQIGLLKKKEYATYEKKGLNFKIWRD